jgi:hypothetical protein
MWRLNFATAKSSDLKFSILQIQRLNSWGWALAGYGFGTIIGRVRA